MRNHRDGFDHSNCIAGTRVFPHALSTVAHLPGIECGIRRLMTFVPGPFDLTCRAILPRTMWASHIIPCKCMLVYVSSLLRTVQQRMGCNTPWLRIYRTGRLYILAQRFSSVQLDDTLHCSNRTKKCLSAIARGRRVLDLFPVWSTSTNSDTIQNILHK